MFITDSENYPVQNDIKGLTGLSDKLETEMHSMLKHFIIFYADDTVIFSDYLDDLQKITIFSEYCDQ